MPMPSKTTETLSWKPQLARTWDQRHFACTIKRQWGYNQYQFNGFGKVNGGQPNIMLVYNIKRSIDILGVPDPHCQTQKWNSYRSKVLFLLKQEVYKAAIRLHFLSN
jgi:hypothetical protein